MQYKRLQEVINKLESWFKNSKALKFHLIMYILTYPLFLFSIIGNRRAHITHSLVEAGSLGGSVECAFDQEVASSSEVFSTVIQFC